MSNPFIYTAPSVVHFIEQRPYNFHTIHQMPSPFTTHINDNEYERNNMFIHRNPSILIEDISDSLPDINNQYSNQQKQFYSSILPSGNHQSYNPQIDHEEEEEDYEHEEAIENDDSISARSIHMILEQNKHLTQMVHHLQKQLNEIQENIENHVKNSQKFQQVMYEHVRNSANKSGEDKKNNSSTQIDPFEDLMSFVVAEKKSNHTE